MSYAEFQSEEISFFILYKCFILLLDGEWGEAMFFQKKESYYPTMIGIEGYFLEL